MGGRGTPIPTSTSGHTGTKVMNSAKAPVRRAFLLCPPS